ncbi:MAG: peptide ABC transporter substrate-binding protein [Candidatus Eremiobacteraeota bacterium]|nr:peptide ABC transporter substrate-binding protein [Candidatus Eremiobacteraeota bacterium]
MRALFALALLAALAGCTRVQQRGAGHNPWTIPGVLRIAQREDPDNLNLLLGTETVDIDISAFWGAYLFRWSDRSELVPELAVVEPTHENGGISRDGLRVTYHLRRNVRWQDGAPFDADDVIYTWQQMLNPRNLIVSRVGYDVISRIDRLDAHTIVVHLKRRFAPFVNTFFAPANHPDVILPKHLLARYPDINRLAYNGLPIGTGPFRIVAYDRNARVEMVANDAYWRGPPRLRRIDFRIVGSDETILTQLQSHDIDFFYRAPESLAPELHGIPGARIVTTPIDRFTDVGLNASIPGLNDVRVRRALAYAIDKPTLVNKVMHGVAVTGDSLHPPFSWAYNPDVARYPYDPARAAALLARAGWPPGKLHLTLVSFTGSNTMTAAEALIQEEWGRAGVVVTIKNFPSGKLYATAGAGGIEQSGKFDAALENWENGTDPDDSILIMCSMAPPNGWNIYHFCSAELDAAERTALSTYDRALRAAAYRRIQRIVSEQLPFIVLWYQMQLDAINTDLREYRPAHAVTPFWNVWQWSI